MSTSQPRIAIVGPLPPPSGGMANQTRQLAELLRAEHLDVEVVQVNAPYRPAWAGKIPGVRAFFRLAPYLLNLWCAAGRVDVFHIMANSGWSWHLFAAPAVWIAKLRGKRTIINYRGGEAETFFKSSFFWVRPTMQAADMVVVPSGFLEDVFGKWKIATTVIPNIINLARFSPAANDENHDYADAPHVIVTRNLEPIYDIPTALHAFALVVQEFPRARLTVAGSGPLRSALEDMAQSLGIASTVTFTGRLESADMAALYKSADLSINPSLVDNMPNSVLEALASGVPVVSTDVGGVPYIVQHGKTAWLVPAGNPKAMADAVTTLLRDPALVRRLVHDGLALVQHYAWPSVRELWLGAYRVLATGIPSTIAAVSEKQSS
ncbi:MAG: glycosyltransferase family 4 protein [Pseudomonadota bacterium]